jgi:hypothetical protein
MEKIQVVRKGQFTLRSHGRRTADGRFSAVFVVSEHPHSEDDKKVSTGLCFDAEIDAADAGLQAALKWLEANRPLA